MPAKSKAQQRFMGMVHAYKKGELKGSEVSKAIKDAAKSMKKKSSKDYASTKHDDLPNKVKSESTKSWNQSLAKIAKDRQLKSLSKKDRETLMKISKMMKKANESVLYENPAASAAAAMAMMKLQNPDTGKKVSAITPLKNKDHKLHGKAKSIFKRLKDKLSKKKPEKKNGVVHNFMRKNESVNEATSLGADMLLGGIATVIRKAGMRPKTAKMMGGGFKVSKRDKVGFKIDVEIRGLDKKKTFPLQFETERGMLYVVIKNKPIKLGKYTMVNQAAQNLKKVGAALIGDKDVKRIA